ncbi:Dirigent protein [Sesbania bispinosa]|nr:Dirigent protein [Sesbania bispinosa]
MGLGFGTIIVIDDVLTSQPELGSQIIEKAQGVYVASSADGTDGAKLRHLIPPGQIATDGAETLLRIIIHLNY